jgi:dihydroneopterin aldolase/2-amino-4-hydroxy-6-hydroxymethyldihydropteridine diphosphokinase
MAICYLGIGSNLGNRKKNIALALKEIDCLKTTKVLKISGLIETAALGGPANQGKFFNAALKIKTCLAPQSLLKALKTIENKLGRPSRYIRYSPRLIDIDILFYGDKKINSKQLKIPHAKAFTRDFVMRPVLEIL